METIRWSPKIRRLRFRPVQRWGLDGLAVSCVICVAICLASRSFADRYADRGYNVMKERCKGNTLLVVAAVAWTVYLVLKWLVPCVFEEMRSASHHPHKHLYAKIQGKWYDFANFEHPGGPIALHLAKDRDATALFKSNHILASPKKLSKVLAKYELSEDASANIAPLDARDDGAHYEWDGFDNDEFVRDLRRMASSYFSRVARVRGIRPCQATKATPERWMLIAALTTALLASLPHFVSGRWWALLLTPQLAWTTICNYWHDGLHFSLSTDWRINASLPYLLPLLSSPWMWYHQHVVGHHAYTNVGHKDPDLAHAPQLMREHVSVRWRASHTNQASWSRLCLVWSVSVGLGLQVVNDLRTNFKLSYNNVVPFSRLAGPRLAAHVAGRVLYVLVLFVWPFQRFPFWKALIWSTFPAASFGWSFMLNSQVNHLTEECCEASDTNFLKHQVVTSQNFGVGSWWCTFFSGGLNHQIEHHLFPTVNHCHLPKLAPMVKQICQKHNVPYNEVAGYGEALKLHLAHTMKMGIKPP